MIIENKVKSVDSFNKEGEHKIEGVPNLYLRVGKSNKVFRYKSKKWLTLGQYGIDTTLRDAEMLSKIISVKLKQGFNVDQIDNTLTITKSPYHFEDQLKQVADIKVNNQVAQVICFGIKVWCVFNHLMMVGAGVSVFMRLAVPA